MTTGLISDTMRLGSDTSVILITALLLVGFIMAKETMTSVPDRRGQAVGRILDVVLVPLLITFAVILAVRLLPAIP